MNIDTADDLSELISQLMDAMTRSDKVPAAQQNEWRQVPNKLQFQIDQAHVSPGIEGELIEEEREPELVRLVLTTSLVPQLSLVIRIAVAGAPSPVSVLSWEGAGPYTWQKGSQIEFFGNGLMGMNEFLKRHQEVRKLRSLAG